MEFDVFRTLHRTGTFRATSGALTEPSVRGMWRPEGVATCHRNPHLPTTIADRAIRPKQQQQMSRETRLRATFDDFRDALFAQDVEALDGILATDYRGYNLRGRLEDRGVVLAAYAPGVVSLETFEVQELQVDVHGEVGIITGKGYVAGSYQGESWEHDLRFCDVYADRDGDWKLLLAHATPMEPDPA